MELDLEIAMATSEWKLDRDIWFGVELVFHGSIMLKPQVVQGQIWKKSRLASTDSVHLEKYAS